MPRPRAVDRRRIAGAVSPTNESAARLLEQIADELAGEASRPSRRVAAYRQAAEGLRASSLSVDELWRAGSDRALTRIRGVTPAIAQVVGNLIATKRISLPVRAERRSGSKR
jgi:DNA polymerase/3'-5' exonuclease PolX